MTKRKRFYLKVLAIGCLNRGELIRALRSANCETAVLACARYLDEQAYLDGPFTRAWNALVVAPRIHSAREELQATRTATCLDRDGKPIGHVGPFHDCHEYDRGRS